MLAAKVELMPGSTLGIEIGANGLEPMYVEAQIFYIPTVEYHLSSIYVRQNYQFSYTIMLYFFLYICYYFVLFVLLKCYIKRNKLLFLRFCVGHTKC
jgi:hypothetical protein